MNELDKAFDIIIKLILNKNINTVCWDGDPLTLIHPDSVTGIPVKSFTLLILEFMNGLVKLILLSDLSIQKKRNQLPIYLIMLQLIQINMVLIMDHFTFYQIVIPKLSTLMK